MGAVKKNARSRQYDSSGRRDQARRTRRTILESARRRFVDHGYAATTIAAIAGDAHVSVETIYKAFGSKAGLIKAVVDVAIAGDDDPVPILQREFVRTNRAEPDPRRKLEAYGSFAAEIAMRTSPLLLVVRAAAGTDPGAAEVWATLQQERLRGMGVFAEDLATNALLRAGVTTDEARDVLWAHNSVELWDLLVNQRGWTQERYGRWLGQQLIAALLPAR